MEWATPFLCLFWVRCACAMGSWWGAHLSSASGQAPNSLGCCASPAGSSPALEIGHLDSLQQRAMHVSSRKGGRRCSQLPRRRSRAWPMQPSAYIPAAAVAGAAAWLLELQHDRHQRSHGKVGLGVRCCTCLIPVHGEFATTSQNADGQHQLCVVDGSCMDGPCVNRACLLQAQIELLSQPGHRSFDAYSRPWHCG